MKEPLRRMEALDALRVRLGAAGRLERNRVAAAVAKGLRREGLAEVRVAAARLLYALHTDRALDRLVVTALDPREEVRTWIEEKVAARADAQLQEAIERALTEDASWRLRAAMVDLLLAGAWDTARHPLLAALHDPHPAVVARAAETLERMTGKPFGPDARRWETYFRREAEKRAARAEAGERRTFARLPQKLKLFTGPVRGLLPVLYTIPIREKRVIFVVDMSSSMRRLARSSHFKELKQALFGLPDDVSFNLLFFDQRLFFFAKAKSLVPATTANKAAAERWIDALPAGERTDVARSVVTGLAMLREALEAGPETRAELFILTDGVETSKTTALRAVKAQYAKLPARRCRIHLVSLGRRGTPPLKGLADASGGRYVEVLPR